MNGVFNFVLFPQYLLQHFTKFYLLTRDKDILPTFLSHTFFLFFFYLPFNFSQLFPFRSTFTKCIQSLAALNIIFEKNPVHPRNCFLFMKESVLIVIRITERFAQNWRNTTAGSTGNGNKAQELSYAEICMEKAAVFYCLYATPLVLWNLYCIFIYLDFDGDSPPYL